MNKIATLDQYVILDDDNPIGYTYDIFSCISMLIHREHSAILAHIESNDTKIDLKQVNTILDLIDDRILDVELFTGKRTNDYNLGLVRTILDNKKIPYTIKKSFIDMYGNGSIGYNYKDNCYYQVNNNNELESISSIKR